MQFKRKVYGCDNDYCGIPDKIIITLSKQEAERILMLSKEVKKLKVYKISEFDYSPNFFETGVEDPDWRLDCVMLNITDNDFFYTAMIKHTNIRIGSEPIKIITLKKKVKNG